jgi:hypothetical protein
VTPLSPPVTAPGGGQPVTWETPGTGRSQGGNGRPRTRTALRGLGLSVIAEAESKTNETGAFFGGVRPPIRLAHTLSAPPSFEPPEATKPPCLDRAIPTQNRGEFDRKEPNAPIGSVGRRSAFL